MILKQLRAVLGWLILAIGAAGVLAIPATAQADQGISIESTDISQFPQIEIVVTAPSLLSRETLNESGFSIYENGSQLPIEVTPGQSARLQVLLLVDTSGSMTGAPIGQARAAATAFAERMPPNTELALMGFGPTPTLFQAFTTDKGAVVDAISLLEVSGETALYDAVVATDPVLSEAYDESIQQHLVILSDGGDTQSVSDLTIAAERLSNSGAKVHVVSLVTAESDETALRTLVTAGGGDLVQANDPDGLIEVFDDVAAGLVNQYTITFDVQVGGAVDLTAAVNTFVHSSSDTTQLILPLVPVTVEVEPDSVDDGAVVVAPPQQPALFATPQRAESRATGSWLYPAGLAAVFAAVSLLLITGRLPSRRDNSLRSWAPSVALSGRTAGSWLKGSPRMLTNIATGILSRHGRDQRLELMLAQAGMDMRSSEFVMLLIVGSTIAAAIGLLWGGILVAIFVAGLSVLTARAILKFRGKARREAFAAQLHGVLTMMSGSLRTGYSLTQSFDAVTREVANPAAEEFRRALVEIQLGRDLIESLEAISHRVDNEDFRWVVEAINISRSVGGDLGEILGNIATTIRDRERISRQIRTLSAEGRMSAWILSGLPLFMAGWLHFTNEEYLAQLTDNSAGRALIGLTVVIMGVGMLWMRRIARPEF